MSNYPPGVSAGHSYFNPPDTSHEHEWQPADELLFEDGAVIFEEYCTHVTALNTEPGYEGDRVITEGIECEETRSYRFDPVSMTKIIPDDDEPNISIHRSVRNTAPEVWDWVLEEVEAAAFPHGEDIEIVGVDPHPRDGCVVVEYKKKRVRYEPIVGEESQ